MQINFKIVSYHRLSPEQVSEISVVQNATFGRSERNDWYLPDPEKVVSSTHAEVTREDSGDFCLYDRSTNGIFINRSVEALGDKKHILTCGDILSIGDYEIVVELSNKAINSLIKKSSFEKPKENTSTRASITNEPAAFFADNLLHHEEPNRGAALPSVNNDLNDHYCIPASIPEEWDINSMTNKTESVVPASAMQEPAISEYSKPKVPAELRQTSPVVTSSENKSSPMDAFIKGLGISNSMTTTSLPDEIYFELGQSMNLMLTGLIKSLRNRTSLKSEFKMNQTTFQQQENNPLKFSATIDDVFQNLYLHRSKSFLSSRNAIQEVFNDTEKHEKALMAGALGALQGLLAQLDPERIRDNNHQEHYLDKIIPKNMQARNWNMFQLLHEDLKNEISTHGSSALTDDFVKAYDQTIKSI